MRNKRRNNSTLWSLFVLLPAIKEFSGKSIPWLFKVMVTRVEVWENAKEDDLDHPLLENEKSCENTSDKRVFPQLFRVLPNFH